MMLLKGSIYTPLVTGGIKISTLSVDVGTVI